MVETEWNQVKVKVNYFTYNVDLVVLLVRIKHMQIKPASENNNI